MGPRTTAKTSSSQQILVGRVRRGSNLLGVWREVPIHRLPWLKKAVARKLHDSLSIHLTKVLVDCTTLLGRKGSSEFASTRGPLLRGALQLWHSHRSQSCHCCELRPTISLRYVFLWIAVSSEKEPRHNPQFPSSHVRSELIITLSNELNFVHNEVHTYRSCKRSARCQH